MPNPVYTYNYVVYSPPTRPNMTFQRSTCSIVVGELGWKYGTGLKSNGTFTNWCTGREWPVNFMTVISAWWRSKYHSKDGRSAYSIGVGWQYGTGLKSNGTFTNWCTGREWPVNFMTVISARWRSKYHSKDGGSAYSDDQLWGEYWVDVELLYNSVHRKFTEFWRSESWRNDAVEKTAPSRRGPRDPRLSSWGSDELETRYGRESQHLAEGALRPPINEFWRPD